jgi:hypothetical protein
MALDRHQELMLDMRQTHCACPVLAPALEAPQCDPEGQQVLEVLPGWLSQRATSITVLSDVSVSVIDVRLPARRMARTRA